MRRLLWLGAVLPLVFFPFMSDPTPVGARDPGTYATGSDTTYADGRYAALVPGVTDTVTQGTDTMVRFLPDPDSIGEGVAYRAIRGGDSFIVLSYDTLIAEALDSSTVDSIWSDWGLGTPYAYVVDLPNQPDDGFANEPAGMTEIAQLSFFEYAEDGWTDLSTHDMLDSTICGR